MTKFGAAILFASWAIQLIVGLLTVDGLRLYNQDAVQTGNRLNHHHGNNNKNNNGGSIRSKSSDPAVKECQFALKLYRQLDSSDEQNVLFSPLSIFTAITALAEGANGTTAKELLTALNRTSAEGSQYRARMSDVMGQLSEKNDHSSSAPYVLNAANRLFVQKDYRLLPSFLRTLQRSYKMEAVRVDFANPQAAESAINDWVSKETYQMITSLVPPGTLDMQTRLVLANAVYFKGDWETMFPEANTRLRPFYYKNDKYVQVPMMSVEAEFPYYDYTKMGFEMIELPYVGRDVSMFVVLPYESQSLNTIARRLLQRPLLLTKPSRKMYSSLITVVLPKFTLEESVDLKVPLAALGVKQAFEQGKADLTAMTSTRELYVSDALHKAAVEVSEKGTRAAAATAIMIKGRSMNSDPVFRADRPFMFFIRHNPTESILFLGNVKQLKDASPNVAPKPRNLSGY